MFKFNNFDKHDAFTPRKALVSKKKVLAITLSAIICCIICGTTLAVLFIRTDPLTNIFAPSEVTCEVIETFDGETKEDVKIKNTGKTSAYIRADIIVTWMSDDGSQVSAISPVEGIDYQISYGSSPWIPSKDGFWYYSLPVEDGKMTSNLIETCACITTPPEGFYLSVEIVASAVQSSPTSVVTECWESGVSGVDGNVLEIIE